MTGPHLLFGSNVDPQKEHEVRDEDVSTVRLQLDESIKPSYLAILGSP